MPVILKPRNIPFSFTPLTKYESFSGSGAVDCTSVPFVVPFGCFEPHDTIESDILELDSESQLDIHSTSTRKKIKTTAGPLSPAALLPARRQKVECVDSDSDLDSSLHCFYDYLNTLLLALH